MGGFKQKSQAVSVSYIAYLIQRYRHGKLIPSFGEMVI